MEDKDYLREFFGDPVFVYTDADAINDGTLIDLTSLKLTFESKAINRMTATVFWRIRPDYPLSDEEMAQFIEDSSDDEEPINFDMPAFARDFEQRLKQVTGEGRIRKVQPDMWLVENEMNGWTLMDPSDY